MVIAEHAATKTKQNIVVTARVAGFDGNDITPRFVSVAGEPLSLVDTANAPVVHLATSAGTQDTADLVGVVVTAKAAGVSGLSIQFVDELEAWSIIENGSVVEVHCEGASLYCGGVCDLVNEQSTLLSATQTGGSDRPGFDFCEGFPIALTGGTPPTITSTTTQVASKLNESTQVTATGGTGATATIEGSFNLEGGNDSGDYIPYVDATDTIEEVIEAGMPWE